MPVSKLYFKSATGRFVFIIPNLTAEPCIGKTGAEGVKIVTI